MVFKALNDGIYKESIVRLPLVVIKPKMGLYHD